MSICLAHTFRWPNLHFFWWPMFSQNMLIWTINTIFDTKNIISGAESGYSDEIKISDGSCNVFCIGVIWLFGYADRFLLNLSYSLCPVYGMKKICISTVKLAAFLCQFQKDDLLHCLRFYFNLANEIRPPPQMIKHM